MSEGEEKGLKTFSLEEVAEHTIAKGEDKSIWIVIHDRVYDVTKFLDEHPGGKAIMIVNAGIDSTEVFEDVGHSSDAREMLKEYLIGELQEADKKGTVYTGPKSWASTSAGNEDNPGWTQWILPVGIALLAAIGYSVNGFWSQLIKSLIFYYN